MRKEIKTLINLINDLIKDNQYINIDYYGNFKDTLRRMNSLL